jgi:GWxTD domain-containing protein
VANPMKTGPLFRGLGLFLAVVFVVTSCAPARAGEKLPTRYRKWLDEEVVYIITKEERDAFLRLTNDEDREKFIERFWQIRNPLPGATSNGYREEHYQRIAFANQHYGNEAGLDGWRTDRGRVYITLGPPQQRSVYYGYRNLRPMEIWFYSSHTPALPPFFYVLFYQRENIGDFRFYSPYFDGPDKLVTTLRVVNDRAKALQAVEDSAGREVARISLSLIPDEPVDLQGATSSLESDVLLSTIRNLANHPLAKADLERRRQLLESVTARLILEGQGLDVLAIPLRDSHGLTRCHYVVRLRRPQDLTVADAGDGRYSISMESRVRVFGSDNKLIFVQEKSVAQTFDQDRLKQIQDKVLGYEGWLPLPPGKYRLDFLLTDWLKKAGYHAEKEVIVPAVPSAGMLIPGVVPFSDAAMVDPAKSDLIPFAMAGVKFTPLLGAQLDLSPGQSLNIVYQIWAPGADPRAYLGQKLDVEYALGRPASPGSTKTVRDQVAKEQFDVTGSLVSGKKISIEGFEPGNYLLRVTLEEPGSQQKAYSIVSFRVRSEPGSTPAWDLLDETAGEDVRKGVPEYQRALCYLNLGQQEDAAKWFRLALEKDPSNEQARARLVDFYFGRQGFREVADLYSPGGITGQTPEQTLLRVAESLDRIGETKKAAQLLESALKVHGPTGPLLLTLSAYYQRLGEAQKAAEFARRGESLVTTSPAKP